MRGKAITIQQKEEILHFLFMENLSWFDIWCNVFNGDPEVIEATYIRRLCRELAKMSVDEIQMWLYRPSSDKSNAGRKRLFSDSDGSAEALLNLTRKNLTCRLRKLKQLWEDIYFYDEDAGVHFGSVSSSTISRELRRHKWSRKVLSRKNVRADPEQQCQFLKYIAPIRPENLINIDGMAHNNEDFLAKTGWAPEGEQARTFQLWINGQQYGVHAAYCRLGFIAWVIYAAPVTQVEVAYFISNALTTALAEMKFEDAFIILDNAANQSTELVHNALHNLVQNRYCHLPAYSPFLAPIEHALANIRNYVRDHESEGYDDSIGLINRAFMVYSVGGERGLAAYNHFDGYEDNHNLWLNGDYDE